MENRKPTNHRMTRREFSHDYSRPGIYHITIRVADGLGHPLGTITGTDEATATVTLTPVGTTVERELLTAITAHYPMVTVDAYVIMPEHLHFILIVRDPIVSSRGHAAHLGQVIAGFKAGCNRAYWAATGQAASAPLADNPTAKPPGALSAPAAPSPSSPAVASVPAGAASPSSTSAPGGFAASPSATSAPGGFAASPSATSAPGGFAASPSAASAPGGFAASPSAAASVPAGAASPSATSAPGGFAARKPRFSTGRCPLFAEGYCDVQPLEPGQLETQRAYIRNNPRSRWLRSSQRTTLTACRTGFTTALTPSALRGYLQRECLSQHATAEVLNAIECRLLLADGKVALDTYGNRQLLSSRLLPVVCHRKDKARLHEQKARCLEEAAHGAVLVSPRIATGEQEIMNAAMHDGFPIVIIHDNGFPNRYHPSTERIDQCANGRLLIVTPWQYQYRGKNEQITVPFCKTMNCVAQAICRLKDDWWKKSYSPAPQVPSASPAPRVSSGSPAGINNKTK